MPRINHAALTVAINDATSAYVNGHYPELPPLQWKLRDRGPRDELVGFADDGDLGAVQAWSETLQLQPKLLPEPGEVSYSGNVDSGTPWRVKVWCITDAAKWQAGVALSAIRRS